MCRLCECACVGCLGICALGVFLAGFYFVFGVVFMVLAFKAKSAVALYDNLLPNYDISLFPLLCVVIGALFTVLTVLGLVGDKKGRKTRLIFAVAQTAVVVLGLYIYIDAYPNESRVEKQLFDGLNQTIHDYGLTTPHGARNVTHDWDVLQEKLECCGVKNYLDWENIRPFGSHSYSVPISCCRPDHRMERCSNHVPFEHPAEANDVIFVQGCLPKVRDEILGTMQFLHWFLVPILIMVCFGIVSSCCQSGVKKSTEMEERKVGPVIIRMQKKKSAGSDPTLYDVEAAEKKNSEEKEQLDNADEDEKEKQDDDPEKEKLNPKAQRVEIVKVK